ncbi:phage holin family protein [Patescibacteria group bacterium]|nr:phage holin family protein [Patescibacteria group bacterium]
MKNTKQQIIKYTLFSWEEQRKNLTLGLFWLVLCLALAFFLMILWFGIMWPPYRDPEAMIVAGIVMLVAVFMAGHCFFIMYAEFILTPLLLKKNIVAWEEFAKEKLKEKINASARLHLLKSLSLNAEDTDDAMKVFEQDMYRDKEIIRRYNESTHEEQLKVFQHATHGKKMVGRILAMLHPYSYWASRRPAGIT